MRKGKDYEGEKKGDLMGFWKSIGGVEVGGNHGGLKTQQHQNQEGKESKECRSYTCEEDQGDYGRKKLWGISGKTEGDRRGW